MPALITFVGNLSTRDPRWWRTSSAADPEGACTSERLHRNTVSGDWWRCVGGAWQAYTCGGEGQPACPRTDIYTVLKNLFEFKAIKTARIEGNVFDRHWVAGQSAAILLLNTSGSSNGYTFALDDVDFRFNRISRTPTAFAVGAPDPAYRAPGRLRVAHNVFDSVLDPESAPGARYLFLGFPNWEPQGLTIRNNTMANSVRDGWAFGLYSSTGQPRCSYCQFLDNVLPWNSNPITGDSGPNAATFFGTSGWYAWPHGRASGNVFSLNGRNPSQSNLDAVTNAPCCRSNAIVDTEAEVLADGLKVNPPYRGMATDGGDPGADTDTVGAIAGQAVAGAANPYLRFRLGSWVATATGATIWYQAPAGPEAPEGACAIRVSASEGLTPEAGEASESACGTARMAVVVGLSPGTAYYFAVTCGSATRRGSFRTRAF